MRIEYHPALADELLEIRNVYESRSAGLGSEFVSEFERLMFRIAAMPERWMVVRNDVRREWHGIKGMVQSGSAWKL